MTDPVLAYIQRNQPVHYVDIMEALNMTSGALTIKLAPLLALKLIEERHDPNRGTYYSASEAKPKPTHGKQTTI